MVHLLLHGNRGNTAYHRANKRVPQYVAHTSALVLLVSLATAQGTRQHADDTAVAITISAACDASVTIIHACLV